MSKQELVGMYYKLDKSKFKLLEKGVSFQFVLQDKEGYLSTGIGTGANMTALNLYNLMALYNARTNDVSIEDFAESVKEGIIKAHNEGWFTIKDNGTK